jgi:hypothetical protein
VVGGNGRATPELTTGYNPAQARTKSKVTNSGESQRRSRGLLVECEALLVRLRLAKVDGFTNPKGHAFSICETCWRF